jgi:hypothetical protein
MLYQSCTIYMLFGAKPLLGLHYLASYIHMYKTMEYRLLRVPPPQIKDCCIFPLCYC